MAEPRETEVKLRVASAEAAREALRRIGAVPARERHFEDNVLFDDERGRSARARASSACAARPTGASSRSRGRGGSRTG